MGTSKIFNYVEQDAVIAKYAKALSHPARVAILQLLLNKQACICGDIVEELPIAQSTVSQHLKALKEAGLIKGNIEGVAVCYCINEAEWHKAQAAFQHFFSQIFAKKSNCC